jgi:hypothetical protein
MNIIEYIHNSLMSNILLTIPIGIGIGLLLAHLTRDKRRR